MRKLLLLLMLMVPASALAQSVRYQGIATGARGLPVPSATIAVCTQPAVTSTTPCSPLATLATSTSTTSGGANPLTGDAIGNFFFYAAPGRYTVQIYSPQISPAFVQVDTVLACDPTGACTYSGTQNFKNLNNIRFASQFAGADLGAKINAADADLGATFGEIWVDASAGTSIATAIALTTGHTLRFIQSGTYSWSGTGCTFQVDNQTGIIGPGSEQLIINNSTTTGLCKKTALTQVFDVTLTGFSIRDNNTGASTTTGFDFTAFNRSQFTDLDVWYKLVGYQMKQPGGVGNFYNKGFHLKANDVKTGIDFDTTNSVNANQFYATEIRRLAGTWDAVGGETGIAVSGVGNQFFGGQISASGANSRAVLYKPSPAANSHNVMHDFYIESSPTTDIDATNVPSPNYVDGFLSDGRTQPIVLDSLGTLNLRSDAANITLNGVAGRPSVIFERPIILTPAGIANLTAQQANISATTLVTPVANGNFRFSCYVVLTQAATTSSTLPSCVLGYTDADTSVAFTNSLTNTSTNNTVGTVGAVTANAAPYTVFAKSGVAITFSTSGYASVGATPMQYAIHVRLEGPF